METTYDELYNTVRDRIGSAYSEEEISVIYDEMTAIRRAQELDLPPKNYYKMFRMLFSERGYKCDLVDMEQEVYFRVTFSVKIEQYTFQIHHQEELSHFERRSGHEEYARVVKKQLGREAVEEYLVSI